MTTWLADKIAFLKGLSNPTPPQKALLDLAKMEARNVYEERLFKSLCQAEKSADRALAAQSKAANLLTKAELATRKARDHQLYLVAGLLGIAGLVDTKTGKPTWDRGELLGGLMALPALADPEMRQIWKRNGDSMLAAHEKGKKRL